MKTITVFLLILTFAACRKKETTDTSLMPQAIDAIDSGNFIIIDSIKHFRHTVNGDIDCKIESFDHGNFMVLTIAWMNTGDSLFQSIVFQDGIGQRMLLRLSRFGKEETYVCQGATFTRTTSNVSFPFVYSGVKMYYTSLKDISLPPTDSSRFVVVSGLTNCR